MEIVNAVLALLLRAAAIAVPLAIAFVILRRSGCAAALLARLRPTNHRFEGPVYRLEPALLSATERAFHEALCLVPHPGLTLCMKVRVADVIGVRSTSIGRRSDFYQHFNPIAQKHFDFVFIRTADARPIAAIELDDKSHRAADRITRDKLLERAAAEAGLPLVRFPAAAAYSAVALNDRLAGVLKVATTTAPPQVPRSLTP